MSDSEEEKPKEIPPPPEGKKIFLSHCNSYEGLTLFKELWNKDQFEENPEWSYAAHSFVGTVKKDEQTARGAFQEPPKGIESFAEYERTQEFRQKLLESDVIIYDLISNSFEEVDYVIKTLKTNNYEKEKTLVLLSSVMAWFNTPPKFEEEKAEDEEGEGEGEAAEEEGSEEEPPSEEEEKAGDDEEEVEPELDENGEPIVVKEPIYFKENDFHQRVPHVDFNHFKTLETTAMSSTNTQPKLRVHVLCSGVRYGNGERTFYDHFQKAWVQNPASLTYFKEGANLMPTIHVVDLARLVRRVVIENPKVHPYIFAIDKSRKPTTQRIVEEISKGMGTGKSSSIEDLDTVSNQVLWKMPFMLDLRMRASDAFKAMPLSEADAELEQEEQDALIEKNKFPWHCKYGIRKNIAKLNKEFNEFRGLNPVKIFITGPPASGKTFYADKLAKFYNIPKVEVKQLVAEVFRMAAIDAEEAGENALINDCIAKIQEVKEKMEEDINEKRAEMEEPEEGWPEIEIKDSEIRVPDELLYKVLKLKLAENACRNRGYILDGFPRTYKDAQNIFLYRPQVQNEDGDWEDPEEIELEEGEEPSFEGFVKTQDIFPSSCIVLQGEDEALMSRIRDLPESAIEGTHYTKDDMLRRLAAYRLANNSEVAEPSVQFFFQEQGIKYCTEKIGTKADFVFNAFKIYIERNEKPYNFMTWDDDEEVERRKVYEASLKSKEILAAEKIKQGEIIEKILRKQKEKTTNDNMEAFRELQKDKIDSDSQQVRNYLFENVVYILADGLHKICTQQPEDPVDTLAQYLFSRSLDVKTPDPSQW